MKYFHNPFRRSRCPECGKTYDPTSTECPYCHASNPEYGPEYRSFRFTANIPWWRQILVFVTGSLGFQLIGVMLSLLVLLILRLGPQSGLSASEWTSFLAEYQKSAQYLTIVNDGAYAILIISLLLILWRSNKTIFASFQNPRTWLGIPLGFGVIMLSVIWNVIASKLGATTNQNETAVETTILYLPVLSVLMTGFVAPFCEELTYRVGAFGFLKRWNRVVAYLVVGLLFGLIHLHDFTSVNEWLAFPSYAIAGFSFCFIYEYFGFGASFLAHATNNVVAVISVILSSLYAQ